ncbi:hypothetical protein [Mucilaginibacter sp. L196]|uniref:hypothetical protein n=1 Tax=Mucilaginibacter sp. L196 TaxID=1641870 RepID=UPI00131CB687|nr:hypothetical protein [Mucilaginibacter sp. L196]
MEFKSFTQSVFDSEKVLAWQPAYHLPNILDKVKANPNLNNDEIQLITNQLFEDYYNNRLLPFFNSNAFKAEKLKILNMLIEATNESIDIYISGLIKRYFPEFQISKSELIEQFQNYGNLAFIIKTVSRGFLLALQHLKVELCDESTKKSEKNSDSLDHRHIAVIYKYKAEARYIPNEFRPSKIKKEFGKGLEKAIYTIWNIKGNTYKAPTAKELETIIPHLKDYPNAQKAAINDLDILSKL